MCWYADAKFGMFIHWGLYALLGRGEWVMARDGIPADEYNRLKEQWTPPSFAPDAWCRAAHDAGMKYAVFTTLHHDGFALFDSAADPFNSMNSPAHCDFVAEYVAVCRRYGLKVGLYYSLVDWRLTGAPEKMKRLAYAQLRELMTRYGKIDLLWYDGAWTPDREKISVADFWEAEKLNGMIRELQPGILINDRAGKKEDFSTIEGRNIIRRPDGAKFWELCITLGDDDFSNWGFCRHTAFRRTPAQALLLLLHTIEHGGNLLLNVGPDENGIIPAWQLEILEQLGPWMRRNGEAVYGTRATDIARPSPDSLQGNSCGFLVAKGESRLYFFCYAWPGTEMRLPTFRGEVARAWIPGTGMELTCRRDGHGVLTVSGLPADPVDPWCTVLAFDLR